jgi:hypothetical protein
MAWTGFVSESKRFCSYANKAPTQKLAWWWALVFDAGPKFYFYTLRDWWQMRHVRRRNSKA